MQPPALPAQLAFWGIAVALSVCVHNAQALIELSEGALQDRGALIALKTSVGNNVGRSKVKTWKSEGHPCLPKPWTHLKCTGDRVTTLDLSDRNIQATLPLDLGSLSQLTTLNLEGNRFTGTLPPEWGDGSGDYGFPKLTYLSLNDNELSGTLPSRAWNQRNVWRSLAYLDLSNNNFHGGLPDGWLSTNRLLKNMQYLDLSNNLLGYSDAGQTLLEGQAAWCLPIADSSSGWCPATPLPGSAPVLRMLDLSYNGLTGQLPQRWGQMFPKLQFLQLQGNQLTAQPATAGAGPTPSALPSFWTSDLGPEAFPQMRTLTLYPGNDWICSPPDWADGGSGFLEVNPDGTYEVADEWDDSPVSSANPHRCPSPAADNPPSISSFAVDPSTKNAKLSWSPPAQAGLVYGYRASLYRWDPTVEDWVDVAGWAGRLFRTFLDAEYPALAPGLSVAPDGAYTLDTGYTSSRSGLHQVQLYSFNLDGDGSSADLVEATLQFAA